MIDKSNIPSDKQGSVIAYSAIKSSFEDMAAKIATGDINNMSELDVYAWQVINEATEELGE